MADIGNWSIKLHHKWQDGMTAEANAFLIYRDDNGVSAVNVRFEGEAVWLNEGIGRVRRNILQTSFLY